LDCPRQIEAFAQFAFVRAHVFLEFLSSKEISGQLERAKVDLLVVSSELELMLKSQKLPSNPANGFMTGSMQRIRKHAITLGISDPETALWIALSLDCVRVLETDKNELLTSDREWVAMIRRCGHLEAALRNETPYG
jgi:hypothetical protein